MTRAEENTSQASTLLVAFVAVDVEMKNAKGYERGPDIRAF